MTPKTDALLIRLTPEDKARLQRVAEAVFLDTSTWARQVLLQAAATVEQTKSAASSPRRRKPTR
jgi:hypothetical protein